MNSLARITGAHVWFAREGESFTIPQSGTVSKTAMPGSTDTVWAYLGTIKEASIEGSSDDVEVWKPAPGVVVLDDVIQVKPQLKITFTVAELGPTGLELIFRTNKLTTGSTEFTPLAVGGGIKGWLQLQVYDQTDSNIVTTVTYVLIKTTGGIKSDGASLCEVQLEARVLYSALNNGGLGA